MIPRPTSASSLCAEAKRRKVKQISKGINRADRAVLVDIIIQMFSKRIGSSNGSEEEAFQSKHKYAQKRIASLKTDEVLKSARLLHSEEGGYALGEVLAKIDELQSRPITKLTRRRIIKLFDDQPLVTEVDDFDFIRSVWPVADMPAANGIYYDNLEAFRKGSRNKNSPTAWIDRSPT